MNALRLFLLSLAVGLTSASAQMPMLFLQPDQRLEFFTQPAGSVDGLALTTQPVVRVIDASGNVVTSSSAKITLSVGSGTLAITPDGTTSANSTLTMSAVSGVATFVGVIFHGSGSVTLKATARKTDSTTYTVISSPVSITAITPTKLDLLLQPAEGVNSLTLLQQPIVEVEDARGQRDATSTVNVTASIASGSGALSGTTTVAAVGGVATFTDLVITGTGAHTLQFASSGLTTVTSASTTVLAGTIPQTALTFGGSSSTASRYAPSSTLNNLPTASSNRMTGAAWIYRTGTGAQSIACKNPSSTAGWNLTLENIDSVEGQIKVAVRHSTQRTSWASGTGAFDTCRVDANKWTFVAFTYDEAATPQVHIYIGTETAVLAEVTSYSPAPGFQQDSIGTYGSDVASDLKVGTENSEGFPFAGRIGCFYARANLATLSELKSLQANLWAAPSAAIIADLGGNGTGTQADLSGNGNTGTVTAATAWPTVEATVTITPATTYQTMNGFGSSMRPSNSPHVMNTFNGATGFASAASIVSPTDLDLVRKALYRQCGLTRIKWNLGAGGTGGQEDVNDNADPFSANTDMFYFGYAVCDGFMNPLVQAKRFGATTLWGATFTMEEYVTNATDPEEYAEYTMQSISRWTNSGIPMAEWSILNEPGLSNTGIHANGVWTGAYVRDAIKALAPRIAAAGMSTIIVAPEDLNSQEADGRLTTILADPTARSALGVVAYHLYGGSDLRASVKTQADAYSKPIYMTEWSVVGWQNWAQTMHEQIATYGCSAVDYMWAFFGDWVGEETLVKLNLSSGTYSGYTLNKQYYIMGQWARFVRPGAVRIAASSDLSAVKPTAFISGTDTVYVLYNGDAAAKQVKINTGSLSLSGKKIFAYRTSATDSWAEVLPGRRPASRIDVSLPASSVTTIVIR